MKNRKTVLKNRFIELIKSDIKNDIVNELMSKFDEQIVAFEDSEDPMKPSLCREEFKKFLEDSIENNIIVNADGVTFGIGDTKKLGLGEELDPETTDCLKIIGTILNGISGEYVLVTSEMTGKLEGRTGKAELWTREGYNKVALDRGWDPDKSTWKFSNFRGISNFFDLELNMDKYLEKLVKNLEKKKEFK